MAHELLPVDLFAERLIMEGSRPQLPHSIVHIEEYKDALAKGSKSYFFMRGVEGFFAGRHTSPIYRTEQWAQSAWYEGHAFANEYTSCVETPDWHDFNRAWLVAFQQADFSILCNRDAYRQSPEDWRCAVFGLYARIYSYCLYSRFDIKQFLYGDNEPLFERAHNAHKFSQCNQPRKGIIQMAQELFKDVVSGSIGTWVGEDDEGNTVLKTDKGFEAFKEVKKVMPYTIRVRYGGGGCAHIRAKKDQYKVGDILLVYHAKKGPGMMAVRELDTCKEEPYEAPEVIKFLHKVKRSK